MAFNFARHGSAMLAVLVGLALGSGCVSETSKSGSETGASGQGTVRQGDLTRAVAQGRLDDTLRLLAQGADVNEQLRLGEGRAMTPLLAAVLSKNADLVRILVRNGANAEATYQDYSIQEIGAYQGSDEVIDALQGGRP